MGFNSDALVTARQSRNMSQTELQEKTAIPQSRLSKAESGILELDPHEVESISRALNYPAELFKLSGSVLVGGSSSVFHRKRSTMPIKHQRQLDATMALRRLSARRLLGEVVIDTGRQFLSLDPDEYGSPEEVARALRHYWKLPPGPIKNMSDLLESAGGIIMMQDFKARKTMGMSCWDGDLALFFINEGLPTEDIRFTLAHELGHLTMHDRPTADPEGEANAFAAEFLAPAHEIYPSLEGLRFNDLQALKMYWKISMKALIMRAAAIGAIDEQESVRLYKQHSARGYNTREPYSVATEPPTLVDLAIAVHLDEHGYSVAELSTLALLNPSELHLLSGQKGRFALSKQAERSDRPNVSYLADRRQ